MSGRFGSHPALLHALRDVIVPVGEEVAVGPERHAEIGVTELPSDHQWIGSLGDHQCHARVARRVRGDAIELGLDHGGAQKRLRKMP